MRTGLTLALLLAARPGVALEPVAGRVEVTAYHPLKTVRASSTRLEVEISGNPAAEAGVHGRVALAIRSLVSGNRNRDSNLWHALGHPTHERIVLFVQRAAFGAGDTLMVAGRLAIRGVERPVQVRLAWTRTSEGVRVRGRFAVRMSDHGVPRPSLLLLKVADQVDVDVDLTLRR